MTDVAIVLGLSTLVIGIAAALLVRLLPTVRLQLIGLTFLAVALPLGAVLASGWVMFHMHDDVKILAVSAASALSAVIGALLVAHWIVKPIDELRLASRKLADGELSARAPRLERPTELQELAASFNEMATNIEDVFDARRQLVAWASHDLRTPVAAVQAMLEAVEDGLATPDEYLPAVAEQIRGLSLLIDDLFELACIDAGALTLQLQQVQPRHVVDTCLRAVNAQALARNVRLEATIDQATPTIAAAPEKVERVLMNLLTNALRHTPNDGTVAVIVGPSERGSTSPSKTPDQDFLVPTPKRLRSILESRRRAHALRRRWRRPRPRDCARTRRSARRNDLGRNAARRRRPLRFRTARRRARNMMPERSFNQTQLEGGTRNTRLEPTCRNLPSAPTATRRRDLLGVRLVCRRLKRSIAPVREARATSLIKRSQAKRGCVSWTPEALSPSRIPGEWMEHLWSPAVRNRGHTSGKRDTLENRSNRPIRNRWQPTATGSERMVRRGRRFESVQRASRAAETIEQSFMR